MPTKIVQRDGKNYAVLPGVGEFEVTGGTGMNAQEPGLLESLGRLTIPGQKEQPGDLKNVARKTLSPEVVGGLAGILGPETGGLSLAIPAAAGAATSVARDLTSDNPADHGALHVTGNALKHAGLNSIPYFGGKLMDAGAAGASTAANLVTGGKSGILSGLLGVLGKGAPAATSAAEDYGQYATAGGQKMLVQKLVDLENAMHAATGTTKIALKRQLDSLESLNTRVVSQMRTPLTTAQALAQAGMQPIRTAADSTRSTILNTLRAVLAGGSLASQ